MNESVNIQPEIKPAEVITSNDHHRLVRLSFQNTTHHGLQEQVAALGSGGVTLHYLRSHKKPKFFILDDREMDSLCEAWLQFRREYFERIAREQAEAEAEQAALLKACIAKSKEYDVIIGQSLGPDPVYSLTFSDPFWHNYWGINHDLRLPDVADRLSIMERYREQAAAHSGDF